MDIFSHALAGASAGFAFGRPVLGAVLAILPDVPIWGPRRGTPPAAYLATHSLPFLALCCAVGGLFVSPWLVLVTLGSHLLFDSFTHGPTWAPRPLWPSPIVFFHGTEWEFFNRPWCIGFFFTLLWTFLWLLYSLQK